MGSGLGQALLVPPVIINSYMYKSSLNVTLHDTVMQMTTHLMTYLYHVADIINLWQHNSNIVRELFHRDYLSIEVYAILLYTGWEFIKVKQIIIVKVCSYISIKKFSFMKSEQQMILWDKC